MRDFIQLAINGSVFEIHNSAAFLNLAQFLRSHLQMVGTKIVCSEGDCGACTVLVSYFRQGSWTDFKTINSCITPVSCLDGACLITVEGLEDSSGLCTVQEQMIAHHGGQCGFCTPGIVCSLAGLAEECSKNKVMVSRESACNHLTGNLCRCTGYEPILTAAQHLDLKTWKSLATRYQTHELEASFSAVSRDEVRIENEGRLIFLPRTVHSALEEKNRNPASRFVSGATDLAVAKNKGKLDLDQIIGLSGIEDLQHIKIEKDHVHIGATVSLWKVQTTLPSLFPELCQYLDLFASPQIKNQGTLMGNLMNGSPIGDMIPPLLVLNAELELRSLTQTRKVPLTEFYKGYRSTALDPSEIGTAVNICRLNKPWMSRFYKVSTRKDLDISTVSFAALLRCEKDIITEARFAMGGVGPTAFRLWEIEDLAKNKPLSLSLFEQLGSSAQSYISPLSDLRASGEYRLKLAKNLFMKLFHETSNEKKP